MFPALITRDSSPGAQLLFVRVDSRGWTCHLDYYFKPKAPHGIGVTHCAICPTSTGLIQRNSEAIGSTMDASNDRDNNS